MTNGYWQKQHLMKSILEDIFKYSDYLIAEECHPVLFDLDIVNPEILPDEHIS